jgi:hypothetical protein
VRVHASSSKPSEAAPAAAPQQAPPPPAASAGGGPVEYVPDPDFNISKVSFGSILTPLGLGLMTYGFGSYFTLLPGTDFSSILLIYGFPISILGFALSYAQLPPVPCKTTRAALELRATQMTDVQKQVREDTTRYRCVCGDPRRACARVHCARAGVALPAGAQPLRAVPSLWLGAVHARLCVEGCINRWARIHRAHAHTSLTAALLLHTGMVTSSTWMRRSTACGCLGARATHPRRCVPRSSACARRSST